MEEQIFAMISFTFGQDFFARKQKCIGIAAAWFRLSLIILASEDSFPSMPINFNLGCWIQTEFFVTACHSQQMLLAQSCYPFP